MNKQFGGSSTELVLAVTIALSGVALLVAGFSVSPVGVIDNSVLIAYGEVATFAGAILGIDWNRSKIKGGN